MSTILEITGLYGGYEEGVNILQGIDLAITEGEAVGIIGLNGSGKSTLGKSVMNLLPYRKGGIIFEGKHIEEKKTHELSRLGIALMHQGGAAFRNLSAWQNLALAAGGSSKLDELKARLEGFIPLLRQSKKELMQSMADKLSGGQRRQLALAMTLAQQPRLVVLDEPSAGLSPKAVDEMYQILRKVREEYGMTILLIEQNIAKAVEFCDRCVMLGNGKSVKEVNKNNIDEINIIFEKGIPRYKKEFWDEVYMHHYDDAPWMQDSWKGDILSFVEKYIPEYATTLLDYGCGNGYMGYYFYKKGFNVDMSDISDILISRIKEKYKNTSISFFQTNIPEDLKGKKYDVIIAWSLFHHINPYDWKDFLCGFKELLNPNGILIIGGWDESDEVIKQDGKKARYTGRETWFINPLVNYINRDDFTLVENTLTSFVVPPFTTSRKQRCFILKRK